jgi:hemoglobin-like flavoprotein
VPEREIEEFIDSLERCLADRRFIDRFYALFLASSPAVAEKFRNTDFDRQKRALTASLYVMVMAVERGSAPLAYLEQIAERHGRRDLDIGPELYDSWLDCLVLAAREHDPKFSERIETLWRKTMQFGIDLMRERY